LTTTAVLIIDVQHALCSGRWACFEVAQVIGRINQVAARARQAGLPVVLIQHEAADGQLDHGSPGWQLAEGLDSAPGDIRVRKTTCDSFHLTELQAQLRQYGVDKLVICGLQTDFCVDTTTRRALALGYPVTLVADGHSTVDNGVLTAAQIIAHHNQTLGSIDSFGVKVAAVPAERVRLAGITGH
jgi:nicotinamidase-related amidase